MPYIAERSLRGLLSGILVLGISKQALALPIGFGLNQGDIPYNEIKTPQFILYHDARSPTEAQATAGNLDAVSPILHSWLGTSRQDPLPVVMSSVTHNASFANFITDAIELQTEGGIGTRDVAWHELTHATMYRHLLNILGPAGSTIHLPFMPAWWIEGLAESTARTVTSDQALGLERTYALNGRWPSYDRLHALYNTNGFGLEGYAISGRFVSYILQTYGTDKLPQLMKDFYHYSMPWWWPWAAVPFNDFMPMDRALGLMTGKSGAELYVAYKAAATAYWQPQGKLLSAKMPAQVFSSAMSRGMQRRGENIVVLRSSLDGHQEQQLIFDESSGWATSASNLGQLPLLGSVARYISVDLEIFVTEDEGPDQSWAPRYHLVSRTTGAPPVQQASGAFISQMSVQADQVFWIEQDFDRTRLCQAPLAPMRANRQIGAAARQCQEFRYPEVLEYLGEGGASELYFHLRTEGRQGDYSQVRALNTQTGKWRDIGLSQWGTPIQLLAQASSGSLWGLFAGRSGRILRKFEADGSCSKSYPLTDFVTEFQVLKSEQLLLGIYAGARSNRYLQISPEALTASDCAPDTGPESPLHWALQQTEKPSFAAALTATDPWRPLTAAITTERLGQRQRAAAAPPDPSYVSEKSQWRGRPVFAVPWVGGDAKGLQLGVLAVPLMDQMQNETLRLSMLYGLESRFPSTEVSLLTTRFSATYSVDVFRYQSYNGPYRDPDTGKRTSLYYDERGLRLTRATTIPEWQMSVASGIKAAELRRYIGPPTIRHGSQHEVFLDIGKGQRLAGTRFSLSHGAAFRVIPAALNRHFEYNVIGLSSTISRPLDLGSWRRSQLSLGLSTSRTRGTKARRLKEVYQPLKTFIPGSGGGYNELNFPLLGPGALTSARYGDTQARAKLAWTTPIVPDLETLIGIFYLERLDFTAFLNYGGAWNGPQPRNADLVTAHGYNLDLSSDVKGITVAVGIGTGQVIGYGFEAYFSFSFDALIN